jgi:hypothetical protein
MRLRLQPRQTRALPRLREKTTAMADRSQLANGAGNPIADNQISVRPMRSATYR